MPNRLQARKTGMTIEAKDIEGEMASSEAMKFDHSMEIPNGPSDEAVAPSWQTQRQGKKGFLKKLFAKNYQPVPNAVRKKRANFKLRKMITPKAPVMVLNEMVGPVTYNFVNTPLGVLNIPPGMFVSQCEVLDEVHTGYGPSKQTAKNNCAEHAIQAFVTKKCLESREKIAKQIESAKDAGQSKPHHFEDDTPWAQLASLALFRLFNEWQNQGYHIPNELLRAPDFTETQQPPAEQKTSPALPEAVMKKFQENLSSRHPVQLLNELRKGISFELVSESGNPPNNIFVMSSEIDGTIYEGRGRSKKDAKKNVAIQILKEVYNLVYPQEVTSMDESV